MDTMEMLAQRMAVAEVVTAVAVYADLHQWDQLRHCFDEQILLDYTSLLGGEPSSTTADMLIENWRRSLTQYQATQHQITNHSVTLTGETAACLAYVHATHWLPEGDDQPFWSLQGYYDYTLRLIDGSWKIQSSRLTALMVTGSQRLRQRAGVRPDRW